jgi:Flp pilus assembly protein TadD
MQVFLPRFTDSKDRFIMASHADRMTRSECFRLSAKLTCITCHNPHLPVHTVPEKHYADACRGCHTSTTMPTHPQAQGKAIAMATANCIPCHMPKSGTTDIPHVTVTDHFIRKAPNVSKDYAKATGAFLGLACINNPKADALTKARAYLQYFDRVEARAVCLDSAAKHLSQAPNSQLRSEAYVYLYFLRREPAKAITAYQQLPKTTQDGWTAYRAGESAIALNRVGDAVSALRQACQLKPYQLDFRLKLGAALLSQGDVAAAEREFAYVVKENPKNARGHVNFGYCRALQSDFTKAETHYRKALALDPDLTQALVNLGGLLAQKGDKSQAIVLLKRAQKLDPQNAQAKAMLAQL